MRGQDMIDLLACESCFLFISLNIWMSSFTLISDNSDWHNERLWDLWCEAWHVIVFWLKQLFHFSTVTGLIILIFVCFSFIFIKQWRRQSNDYLISMKLRLLLFLNHKCHISIYFEIFLAWSTNFLKIWKITAGKKDSSSIQQSSTPMNHEWRQKIIKSVIGVATQCPHQMDHSGIFSRDLCDFITFYDFCQEMIQDKYPQNMKWSRCNVYLN